MEICLITYGYGLSENQGDETVSSFDALPPSRLPVLFTWKIACLQASVKQTVKILQRLRSEAKLNN